MLPGCLVEPVLEIEIIQQNIENLHSDSDTRTIGNLQYFALSSELF